jgi:hypothetical protein|tara:strand:+ start:461 stop:964 length:504 start_codon:yes stop_codon:yes gene_type:complete
MTSILRVDSIQTSSGGSATASGLGIDIGSTGKIGQVVQTVSDSKIASTSTSFTDVLTVDITPTATSSKVLIQFVGSFGCGGDNIDMFYQILRGSSVLQVPYHIGDVVIQGTRTNASYSCTLLDSPSTTSATTYKMQFKTASNEIFLNRNGDNDQCGFTTFTVSEVLA